MLAIGRCYQVKLSLQWIEGSWTSFVQRTLVISGSCRRPFADGSGAIALNNAQAARTQDVGWHETPKSYDCQTKSATAVSRNCVTFAHTDCNCPSSDTHLPPHEDTVHIHSTHMWRRETALSPSRIGTSATVSVVDDHF